MWHSWTNQKQNLERRCQGAPLEPIFRPVAQKVLAPCRHTRLRPGHAPQKPAGLPSSPGRGLPQHEEGHRRGDEENGKPEFRRQLGSTSATASANLFEIVVLNFAGRLFPGAPINHGGQEARWEFSHMAAGAGFEPVGP